MYIDSANISQYFPAYIRNKEKWDKLKGKWISLKDLNLVIKLNPEETFLKWL